MNCENCKRIIKQSETAELFENGVSIWKACVYCVESVAIGDKLNGIIERIEFNKINENTAN